MKQVEYVSIGGYVFSLEDSASHAAKEYLDQLEAFYSKKESGAEVMEGIEERMAELLLEKSGKGGVVTLAMVNDVISVLGRPETIEEETSDAPDISGASRVGEPGRTTSPQGPQDPTANVSPSRVGEPGRTTSPDAESAEASDCTSKNSNKAASRPRRRLYRDPANGKLAGVCSGLATYFNVDPAIFRILFVVLTLLGVLNFRFWLLEPWIHISIPLVYIVLWICMPAVKTVRQRDELRGEGGTVDDISERVRNTPREEPRTRDSQTWKNISRIFSVIFGVFLLLAGVAGIAFLCSFWWGGEILGNSFFYNKFIEHIAIEAPEVLSFISVPIVMVSAILVIAIPLFIMLYGGVMLIFGLKSPKWHPGLILFVIWLIILVALSVSSLMTFAVID